MAIASLVSGILGVVVCPFVGSLPAVITGHIALRQIAASGNTLGGRGLAIAGLVLGYVMLGVGALVLLWIVAMAVLSALFAGGT